MSKLKEYVKIVTGDKPDKKILVMYLEGSLVNYSIRILTTSEEEEEENAKIEATNKNSSSRMFVNVSNSRNDKYKYYDIHFRPNAQWFIKVASTRFDIYMIHQYPESIYNQIISRIDPESRIKRSYQADNPVVTEAFVTKVTRRSPTPLKTTLIISPYIPSEETLLQNHYSIPIYEKYSKDHELQVLVMLFEYLSMEEDIRPVKLKFHSYPVKGLTENEEVLVETDEDIYNLYRPKNMIDTPADTKRDVISETEDAAKFNKEIPHARRAQGKNTLISRY